MNSSTTYPESISDHPSPTFSPLLQWKLHWLTAPASNSLNWHWLYVIYGLVFWQVIDISWKYGWKSPSNILIAAYPTPLGRWLTALQMIVDPERLLHKAYNLSNGMPFAIPMTDRWIIFVTDPDQLQQLESESQSTLSQEDALHELAFTGSILGQHQVPPEHKGPMSEAFRVTVGVLKNNLRSNIPAMSRAIRIRVKEAIDLEVAPKNEKIDESSDGWKKLRLMPALLHIFTRVNLMVFVGEEQAEQDAVYQNVMRFFWSCAIAFPVLSFVPSFLLPLIGTLATGWGIARRKVFSLLLWLTYRALNEDDASNNNNNSKRNITRWITQITKLQDAIVIAKITLGLLFASAFQVPMVAQFCIHKICKYPEYYEKLRSEAVKYKNASFGSMNQEMPYMDSFIKETARTTPGIILSAPRRVMIPYTSAHGWHAPIGTWVAIPQVSLMQDEKLWQRASSFEGFRFVNKDGTSKSRLTHPSYDFPFWGSIRHACPARFYVSMVMKMILGHLMIEYEFKLSNANSKPFLAFGKMRLPNPFMSVLVRKRSDVGS